MNKEIAGFFLDKWYVFDNYAPFQVEWRGKLYPTSEHVYQAAKFFDTDSELAEKIRLCRSPREAGNLAHDNEKLRVVNWDDMKLEVMEEIVRAKLSQHELVSETLKKSGSLTIVEMNSNDEFWGWGKAPEHSGRNELGKIWMRLRDEMNKKVENVV
jgi:ribA/ribD-fused uncharacterized protein